MNLNFWCRYFVRRAQKEHSHTLALVLYCRMLVTLMLQARTPLRGTLLACESYYPSQWVINPGPADGLLDTKSGDDDHDHLN